MMERSPAVGSTRRGSPVNGTRYPPQTAGEPMSKMVETVKRVQAWQESSAGRHARKPATMRRAGSSVPGPHFRVEGAAPTTTPPSATVPVVSEAPVVSRPPGPSLRIDRPTRPDEPSQAFCEMAQSSGGARAKIELLARDETDRLFQMIHGQFNYTGPICVAFTSTNTEDGKTTLLINLGIAAGRTPGARVLVVDGNLRKSFITTQLGLRPPIGLTDVLVDGIAPIEVIRPSPFAAFDVMPVGRPISDGAAILGSRRMGTLVWELKRHYSIIFIDAPPIMKYPDAGLLGPVCDGTYLVARIRHTRREQLARATQRLKAAGSSVRGCLLTSASEQ